MRKLLILSLGLWSLLAGAVLPEQAATALQHYLQSIHTLEAKFTQTTHDASQRLLEQTQGFVKLRKPHHLFWQVTAPYPQQLVTNGVKLWLYEPELQQVTIQPYEHYQKQAPLFFLLDKDPKLLSTHFTVTVHSKNNEQTFTLYPKDEHVAYRLATLHVIEQKLSKIIILDYFDQTTTVTFTQVKINPPLAPEQFEFIPPKGIDVIEQAFP